MENNPININREKIIYHFPGDPGNYNSIHTQLFKYILNNSFTILQQH